MKLLVAIAALAIPGVAGAQNFSNPQPTMNMPNYSTLQSSVEGRDPFSQPESPAVKREKLARAIALRNEAYAMIERNGGTLSRRDVLYLNRQARLILAYR